MLRQGNLAWRAAITLIPGIIALEEYCSGKAETGLLWKILRAVLALLESIFYGINKIFIYLTHQLLLKTYTMRKILLTFALVCFAANLMAGGLVTNTNQSAAWTRLMCRGASLDVDAVYYNPAGTVMMEKGLHFSVSNQTITQTRWINTNFPLLDGVTPTQTREYIGDVFAPAFPSIYGVFNMGKIAVSAAFNPIGGGGGATFSDGIPRIEYDPSLIAYSLSDYGVTGYDLEAKFRSFFYLFWLPA